MDGKSKISFFLKYVYIIGVAIPAATSKDAKEPSPVTKVMVYPTIGMDPMGNVTKRTPREEKNPRIRIAAVKHRPAFVLVAKLQKKSRKIGLFKAIFAGGVKLSVKLLGYLGTKTTDPYCTKF
jgi:hypothetical protein